jgi:pyruvate formate lyase activating enzyme
VAIYKITYSDKYRRATLHNQGCNFRCKGCSYKLKEPIFPERYPSTEEIEERLRGLDAAAVHFMGGEPTTNPELPDLLAFCKRELAATTRLGHTNGSGLVIDNLDGSNVSFKAFDDDLHRDYTGRPAAPVYDNFRRAYEAGIDLKASAVLIPGYCDVDQIQQIVGFIAGLDRRIPFHLMGYIPVPGTPWRRPTDEEMERAVGIAREHLDTVTFSHLTAEQYVTGKRTDDLFVVRQVL